MTSFLLKRDLILLTLLIGFTHAKEWTYEEPDWTEEYPQCGGEMQSPIDLKTADAELETGEDSFELLHWEDEPDKLESTTTNTGHAVEFETDQLAAIVKIETIVYKVCKVVYHWGSDASKGSEHSIDGKFYSGEIQFIFRQTGKVKDPMVLIMSRFLEETEGLEQDIDMLTGFSHLVKKVIEAGQQFNLTRAKKSFSPAQLLPADTSALSYQGSLTAPPCTEYVERIILKEPLPVTKTFMDTLRSLKKFDGEPLVNNFRPLQTSNPPIFKNYE